jgi:XTP/dITP diphosphohydrolase
VSPDWVVATGNPGKLREFRQVLRELPVVLHPLSDFPAVELPDEGDDYEANAVAKARTAARATGRPALADDSGLEVEALEGRPGPHSARYGGEGLDDAGRVSLLLQELEGVPAEARRARFVCVAAFVEPQGRTLVARGECPGRILPAPRGSDGFGYDPVFLPEGEAVSAAELEPERKNALSHRGRALRTLLARISDQAG